MLVVATGAAGLDLGTAVLTGFAAGGGAEATAAGGGAAAAVTGRMGGCTGLAGGADARQRVFLEIKAALTLHATLEEHIVYPALRSVPDPEAQGGATEAFDEHEDIKGLLSQLET